MENTRRRGDDDDECGGMMMMVSYSASSTPPTPATPLPLLKSSMRHDGGQIAGYGPPNVNAAIGGNVNAAIAGGAETEARRNKPIWSELAPACGHGSCAFTPAPAGACSVPSISLTRKIGAEFFGTFVLMFIATGAVIVNEKTGGSLTIIGNSASAGLAVMAVILSVGHISGAHLNPCLTISFATLRKFPWTQVPAYLVAQIVGSICASFALKGIFNPDLQGGVTVPAGSDLQSFALEFVISFNLMFVVTAVATDTRAVGELAGIAVGATVMMNILISGATSGGSMNPVRTLGPAIAANNYKGLWLYMIGPPLGALAGATAYTLIRLSDDDPGPSRSVRSFRRAASTAADAAATP